MSLVVKLNSYSHQPKFKARTTYQKNFQLIYEKDSHREHLLLLLGLPVFPPLTGLLDLGSAGVSLVSVELEMVSG